MTSLGGRWGWRRLVAAPTSTSDVGERRSIELVATLVLGVAALEAVFLAISLVVAPALVVPKLPTLLVLAASFAVIYALNRTRHHYVATCLFCVGPLWSNVAVGLTTPADPIWYGLVPMSVILASALLRLREALVAGALGLAAVIAVLLFRSDAYSVEHAILITGLVGLVSGVALGMARFRAGVEALRLAEVERLAAQLAATRRLESIGRMAGSIAHDFNNLLTVILTSAELARKGRDGAVDDITAAGERAAAMTRQLLAFSSNRAAAADIVQPDEVLAGLLPLLRRLAPGTVAVELERGAPWPVAVGESQLQQIVLNLTANACDAMPDGGRLTLATSTAHIADGAPPPRRSGDHVLLTVVDTGAGMDAETRERAFEPFFTTKPIGRGTGLGLATVQAIVGKSGGWVELTSQPGAGTAFTIGFPRSLATPRSTVQPPRRALRKLAGLVLLVEDDPHIRRVAGQLLESMGLSVVSAAHAGEVPRALSDAARPIDLLITDVVLPGTSGLALVDELRTTWPDLPVLLMSGYAEDDVQSALDHRSTRFLAKPFTPAALSSAAGELLAESERRREVAPAG